MRNRRSTMSAQTAGLALGLAFLALPAAAQDAPPMPPMPGDVVLADLGAPRGIAFNEAGDLLVADAGTGGAEEMMMMGPEGETLNRVGLSGRVLSVAADGTVTPVLQALPSIAAPSETTGVYRAIPRGDALWVLNTTNGPFSPLANTLLELDLTTGFARRFIPLAQYEALNNPDGNEIDSNVTDLAWLDDGTMLITDAGANTLYSWTEADGLAVVATWPDNSVPTSVEVADNGDIYVGFLGSGVAPGAGKVERWSNGELAETFGGLTAVTDVLVDGDMVYAVQLFIFGEQGPGPGSVVSLTAEGAEPVAEGLIAPFGLAQDADGALYVSYGTLAFAPGMTGGVLKIAQ